MLIIGREKKVKLQEFEKDFIRPEFKVTTE